MTGSQIGNMAFSLVNRTRIIAFVGASLLMLFPIVSCKRNIPQEITPALAAEMKREASLDLPNSAKLISHIQYESRLNSDIWLFEFAHSNHVQYPKELLIMSRDRARDNARYMERMGNISIGNPTVWYFGSWHMPNSQCNATLITVSNIDYLMLEILH